MSANLSSELSSPVSTLEALLGAAIPDWDALRRRAIDAAKRTPAVGTLAYEARSVISSKRALHRGPRYDVWPIEGGIALFRHPGLLDILFASIGRLLGFILRPLFLLKQRFEVVLQALAAKLGPLFTIPAIPIAFIGGIVDCIALLTSLIRRLPLLLFSPIVLIREILLLPVRFVVAFVARAAWSLLLPWMARLVESLRIDPSKIQAMLRRYPWARGVLLGFLRRNRPEYPVLIPLVGLSQVLKTERRSLFGPRAFLIAVEGEPLKLGLWNALVVKVRERVLPFYWERTAHVLSPPRGREDLLRHLEQFLGGKLAPW